MKEIREAQQRALDEIDAQLIDCSIKASALSMDSVAEVIRQARLKLEATKTKVALDLATYRQEEAAL